jgi:hypothetical protein
MRKRITKLALPSTAATTGASQPQARRDFLALNQDQHLGFIDEPTVLVRVPVCRKTWGKWRKKGLIPYVRIGRRNLYDWESVRAALLRMQRGGEQ